MMWEGVLEFDAAELEALKREGKQLDIRLIGALLIANDVRFIWQ
jgi:hypothetical protein